MLQLTGYIYSCLSSEDGAAVKASMQVQLGEKPDWGTGKIFWQIKAVFSGPCNWKDSGVFLPDKSWKENKRTNLASLPHYFSPEFSHEVFSGHISIIG